MNLDDIYGVGLGVTDCSGGKWADEYVKSHTCSKCGKLFKTFQLQHPNTADACKNPCDCTTKVRIKRASGKPSIPRWKIKRAVRKVMEKKNKER